MADQKTRQYVMIGIIAVCLVVSAAMLLPWLMGADQALPPKVDRVFYFDPASKKLSPGDPKSPPGGSPRAYVFGCGGCEEDKRIVAYLERFSAEARQAMQSSGKLDKAAKEAIAKGHEIGTPDGATWHLYNSAEAKKLINESNDDSKCSGGKLIRCTPEPVEQGG